ncbi:hypothetical protein FOCC_FOCC015799 [Frankliniella occidentalis]|uniref:Vacuolar fusion protein MON1 homolog n=1 Tax=Frankliniella occidentalis TaxID=133901 RepID=A0A6J1SIR4_FRAOC|nr:protein SAND [Frankliniella occidentalis]KAE8738703.1 hypothetical protein FOCC_FOCC015799 [Frankliniella occidentalis]
MASSKSEEDVDDKGENDEGKHPEGNLLNFEPEVPVESMLVPTDNFDSFEQEAPPDPATLQDDDNLVECQKIARNTSDENTEDPDKNGTSRSMSELSLVSVESSEPQQVDDEVSNNSEWRSQEKHIFILSSAGKPIYSRHGSEDKLVTLFGVMQALVSFIGDDGDTVRSIHAQGTLFVFLIKGPIILACVCKTRESVSQITVQLNYVYSQIVSVLTLEQLTRIYEQRRNYDLRRLLAGAERLVDHLLIALETQPALLLGAVQCLPLASTTRDTITSTIVSCCNKIKNLVFAILVGGNQLVTLIRMKKFFLHPADLHLILNLVNSSESFKAAESWTPICLPKFNSRGFLHAHVSYLAEDCQACLLLLTVDPDLFFPLSEAKQKIVEKLRRASLLQSINAALAHPGTPVSQLGVPEARHFLYKCKATAQFWGPVPAPPYQSSEGAKRLLDQYRVLHHRLHAPSQPLKLLYLQDHAETMLGWITTGFELYVAFEPLVTKANAISAVNKILRWIKKDENGLFITNAPTF